MGNAKENRRRGSFQADTAASAATLDEAANPKFSMTEYLVAQYGPTLTPNQVGEVVHSHPNTIRAQCANGTMPAARIGDRWVIPAPALATILEGRA